MTYGSTAASARPSRPFHIFPLLSHRCDIVDDTLGSLPTCEAGDHPCREVVGAQATARGSNVSVRDKRLVKDFHSRFLNPRLRFRIGACRKVRKKAKLRKHHTHHHDLALMGKWNFNITFPICDAVMGTSYKD